MPFLFCSLFKCIFIYSYFPGSFDILVYTEKDLAVPDKWGETGPHLIHNSEEVRLKSFSTSVHKINAAVAFKKS